MKKRVDECLFCRSRSCYTKICTDDFIFDEVACNNHILDLEKHSDKVLGKDNGVMRSHVTSTARLKRGHQHYVGGEI